MTPRVRVTDPRPGSWPAHDRLRGLSGRGVLQRSPPGERHARAGLPEGTPLPTEVSLSGPLTAWPMGVAVRGGGADRWHTAPGRGRRGPGPRPDGQTAGCRAATSPHGRRGVGCKGLAGDLLTGPLPPGPPASPRSPRAGSAAALLEQLVELGLHPGHPGQPGGQLLRLGLGPLLLGEKSTGDRGGDQAYQRDAHDRAARPARRGRRGRRRRPPGSPGCWPPAGHPRRAGDPARARRPAGESAGRPRA